MRKVTNEEVINAIKNIKLDEELKIAIGTNDNQFDGNLIFGIKRLKLFCNEIVIVGLYYSEDTTKVTDWQNVEFIADDILEHIGTIAIESQMIEEELNIYLEI